MKNKILKTILIEIVHDIRTQTPIGLKGDYHSFASLPLRIHPFAENNKQVK